ncbi:uncharacterized protein LOC131222567 isoform X2 [Magnolia sinica]|uniref:uncharacterized protein LOC131222567 isoform X2 n=1 Tax=Magnolia sinica TaxID=86752 RepID=UPI00265A7542|nr:uncharacterized protein LOC131222567 isoform X2 [Magnolia sinica]
MAFHVACPITCRRICSCTLGFPGKLQSERGRRDFLEEISRVEEFLKDPWSVRAGGRSTVQVVVPRITVPAAGVVGVDGFGGGDGVDGDEILSAQTKRAAMQRRAVAASMAAEDYARRFENGSLVDVAGEAVQDLAGEDHGSSTVNIMCRICFSGENEGSARAMRMLSCKVCNKKYHRNCLKSWAQFRDLFHWSSWACPSCRICEVCRRVGDPNKLMFCKRCDGAYHCYCQQPPHKNVSAGPFLCSKHTRCHSCGSAVPGSGLSTRWFLGYTFCDACGRLFVKGNYCPVCLKVYRDSESTPMVCCDACQRWVHCHCDGISDEKYLQFQADRNLYYKCAACRGECYQVKDVDDAVQELWRRRDKADRDQIASLRATAGLPTKEEIFSICPYSDDEENGPIIVKNDYGRSLKLSLKGLVEKGTKNTKEYGKKYAKGTSLSKKYVKKKKYHVSLIGKTGEPQQNFEGLLETRSLESSLGDERTYRSEGPEVVLPPTTRSPGINKVKSSFSQSGNTNHNFIEVAGDNVNRAPKVIQIKSSKSHGLDLGEGTGKHASKTETVKGKKLVIHLASRNRNITNSPRSEASSCQREQDLAASNGSGETSQQMANDKKYMPEVPGGMARLDDGKGDKVDSGNELRSKKHSGKVSSTIKLGKVKLEVSQSNTKVSRGNITEELDSASEITPTVLGRRDVQESSTAVEPVTVAALRNDEGLLRKHSKGGSIGLRVESHDNILLPPVSGSISKDPKPLLKLKFKNPYFGNQSSWVSQGEEEKNTVKGQRSKRKRPSPSTEKAPAREDENDGHLQQENPINDEVMDANWILKKLGKDAIGKRVEVHQPSDNSCLLAFPQKAPFALHGV